MIRAEEKQIPFGDDNKKHKGKITAGPPPSAKDDKEERRC
jgi:hypothetical protein